MNFFFNFFGKGNSNRCFSLPKNRTTSHQKKKKKKEKAGQRHWITTTKHLFRLVSLWPCLCKGDRQNIKLTCNFCKKEDSLFIKKTKKKKRKKGKKKKKEDSLYSIKTYHYQRSDYLLYGGHRLHQSLKTRFMSRILVQYIL